MHQMYDCLKPSQGERMTALYCTYYAKDPSRHNQELSPMPSNITNPSHIPLFKFSSIFTSFQSTEIGLQNIFNILANHRPKRSIPRHQPIRARSADEDLNIDRWKDSSLHSPTYLFAFLCWPRFVSLLFKCSDREEGITMDTEDGEEDADTISKIRVSPVLGWFLDDAPTARRESGSW
jgi:hypothetical protein